MQRINSKSKSSPAKLILPIVLVTVFSILASSFANIPATKTVKTAKAETVEQLNQKKAQLEAQAKAAQQAANQQKTVAEKAADQIETVNQQINEVQEIIQSTTQNINKVKDQISARNQEIANLESELRKIKDQQDALIRQMYIMRQSNPDHLVYFSNESISDREQRQAQMIGLKKSVSSLMTKTQAAKVDVESKKTKLVEENQKLEIEKLQNDDQKRQLASYKSQQASLKNNAEYAASQYDAQADAAKQKIAEVEKKIRTLSATSNWGSQIVSSNDWWYFAQTGNYTRLGRSWYTVNDYGCLITSIAMISRYYGNTYMNPTYVAQKGSFDYGGYYYGGPSDLGISIAGSVPVNWNTVNQELAVGHPVIVSVYLPSVGDIGNGDGSSHFIVLRALEDGKYLMHDPIGAGRSYNLNQVRSMKIVRN